MTFEEMRELSDFIAVVARAAKGPCCSLGDDWTCADCEGTGDCSECEGSGEVECECPNCDDTHDADCNECDGSGQCNHCEGAGFCPRAESELAETFREVAKREWLDILDEVAPEKPSLNAFRDSFERMFGRRPTKQEETSWVGAALDVAKRAGQRVNLADWK